MSNVMKVSLGSLEEIKNCGSPVARALTIYENISISYVTCKR